MPDLAEALPAANSNCGRRIGMDPDLQVPSKILQQALHSQCLSRSKDYSMELGLTAGQRYRRLSLRPKLDEALAEHRCSS